MGGVFVNRFLLCAWRYTEPRVPKCHCRTETWRNIKVAGSCKISGGKNWPYTASIDLWLAILGDQWSQLSISLQSYNTQREWRKRLVTMEQGWKRGEGGKERRHFQRIFRKKKNFFSRSAFPVRFLSGQQHNEQTEEKKNCKELFVYCIFSSPLAAVLCLKMESFECVSMSLCVGCVRACVRWLVQYSIFSFSHIKGAINFLLLLLPECNTQARIAERLGHDLANMQDELIYQTPQTKACQKMRDKTEDRGGRGWGEGGTGFIRRNTVWDEETEG